MNEIKVSSEANFNIINKYIQSFHPISSRYTTQILFNTKIDPTYFMLHIGVGGFHRSHQAYTMNELNKLSTTTEKWGIIGVGLTKHDERIYKSLLKQQFLYTLISRCNSHSTVEIIDVIKEFQFVPKWNKRCQMKSLVSPNIPVISMTVTEKGYYMDENQNLNWNAEDIQHDYKKWKSQLGICKPKTIFGFICTYIFHARQLNYDPVTIMSCDNLKENGSLCQKLCLEFCRKVDPYLAEYIHKSICFPNSMVDRITPYTTNTDRFVLQLNYNIIDDIAVVCENYVSWVIQDKFSSIVPPFQNAAHVILTDTPEIYEQQKLVLLNSTHSFMAYIGFIFDVKFVYQFMMDEKYVQILSEYMDEIIPSLPEAVEMNYENYKKQILTRFSNHYIKDELSRIAQDGSQKIRMTLSSVVTYFYNKDKNHAPKYVCLFLALFLNFMNPKNKTINDPLFETLEKVYPKELSVDTVKRFYSHIFSKTLCEYHKLFEQICVFLEQIRKGKNLFELKN